MKNSFVETELLGKTYIILYNIANKSLQAANALGKINDIFIKDGSIPRVPYYDYCQLSPSELNIIALDYSFSVIESFINHLCFIFCEPQLSAKRRMNYNEQVDIVRSALCEIRPDTYCHFNNVFDESGMFKGKYNSLRYLRNDIHHTHANEYDYISTDQMEPDSLYLALNHATIGVRPKDSSDVFKMADSFIKNIHCTLRKDMPNDLFDYLLRARGNKLEGRKKLLDKFLQDPFSPPYATTYKHIKESTCN